MDTGESIAMLSGCLAATSSPNRDSSSTILMTDITPNVHTSPRLREGYILKCMFAFYIYIHISILSIPPNNTHPLYSFVCDLGGREEGYCQWEFCSIAVQFDIGFLDCSEMHYNQSIFFSSSFSSSSSYGSFVTSAFHLFLDHRCSFSLRKFVQLAQTPVKLSVENRRIVLLRVKQNVLKLREKLFKTECKGKLKNGELCPPWWCGVVRFSLNGVRFTNEWWCLLTSGGVSDCVMFSLNGVRLLTSSGG
ncbi:hypothetical protein ADUPG1_013434, partial [Aduncisulcus paluster]